MAPHSSTLAWKIPWMEELDRLQAMGSQSRTRLNDFSFIISKSFLFRALFFNELIYFYLRIITILW